MQCLSKKASGSKSVVRVAEACCGINSQDLRESFSSFWARIEGFKDSDLLNEYKPGGGLVRTWTIRSTMHTFPSKDYYIHVFGSGCKKILSRYDSWAKRLGLPPREIRIESLYQPLLEQIKGMSVTSDYIKQYMTERLTQLGLKSEMKLRRGWSSQPTYGPSWVGITEMSYLGLLVSAGRKGSQSLWMRSSDWLNTNMKVPDPEDCVIESVRRFIQRYGPVSRADISYWSNRLLAGEVDGSISVLRKELVIERFEGSNETYYSFEGSYDDFVEPPEVIVLPEFDSLMMGFKDRSRFLSSDRLGSVSRPQGLISRTILVDGFVAATWGRRRERGGVIVSVMPFRDLVTREKRSIEEKLGGYGEYLGTNIRVEFRGPL